MVNDERKNGWLGIDNLTVEWCFHCNKIQSIKWMNEDIQGMCRTCKREKKESVKRGNSRRT